MSHKLIWFSDIDSADRYVVGNKAAGLASLVVDGFAVPNGFVVPHDFVLNEQGKRMLAQALSKLTGPFAVRSSSSAEDSALQAFPGIFLTLLHCQNTADVLEAIQQIRESCTDKKALSYSKKHGLMHKTISMSVIVQSMVQAAAAGVAFSHDPSSGRHLTVIESNWGLGESVVSGAVTPDHYEISVSQTNITAKLGTKSVKTSTKLIETTPIERENFSLSDQQVLEIASVVQQRSKLAGRPEDIEWAYEDGTLYILQSRPITTIQTSPTIAIDDPLSMPLAKDVEWQFYVSRPFSWCIEDIQFHSIQPETQKAVLGFYAPIRNYLILNGDEYGSRQDTAAYNALLADSWQHDPTFFEKFAAIERTIGQKAAQDADELLKTACSALNDDELISYIGEFEHKYTHSFVPTWVRPDDFLERELRNRLKIELPSQDIDKVFRDLAAAGPLEQLDYTSEPYELLKIAQAIKEGSPKTSQLHTHAARFGWMKQPLSTSLELFTEKDFMSRVSQLIAAGNIDKKLHAITTSREHATRNYRALLQSSELSEQSRQLLRALHDFIFLRTYTTERSDQLFFAAKHSLLTEVAKRVQWSLEDICMLTFREMIDLIKQPLFAPYSQTLVANRRAGFALTWVDGEVRIATGPLAAQLSTKFSRDFKQGSSGHQSMADSILHGACANPGVVTGRVRVLTDPSQIHQFEQGEILVTSMTTPEYVAAMEKAAAFITDEGGVTCHAAITAREFGVPCITGTTNATSVLKNGDTVFLDAANGIVKIQSRSELS